MTSELYKRIDSGYYAMRDVKLPQKPSSRDVVARASGLLAKRVAEYTKENAAYKAEKRKRNGEFLYDLAKYHGIDHEHPKTIKAYGIAWEHGHSSGYAEVASYFEDLVPLIKD